jgi:hypothetical protein
MITLREIARVLGGKVENGKPILAKLGGGGKGLMEDSTLQRRSREAAVEQRRAGCVGSRSEENRNVRNRRISAQRCLRALLCVTGNGRADGPKIAAGRRHHGTERRIRAGFEHVGGACCLPRCGRH